MNRFVLIVAISKYPDRTMGTLPGARKDADDVRATLREHADGGVHRVIALLEAQATKDNIRAALDQIRTAAGETAQVIVYFAGHGASDLDRYCLLPYDATFATAATQGISAAELSEWLSQIQAAELVFIMDCCHSAGVGAIPWPPAVLKQIVGGWLNRYVMSSAGVRELAGEADGGGLFTQALLAALKGKGLSPDDEGRISAQAAFAQAAAVTEATAGHHGLTQHPVNAGNGSLIYVTRVPLRPPPRTEAELREVRDELDRIGREIEQTKEIPKLQLLLQDVGALEQRLSALREGPVAHDIRP